MAYKALYRSYRPNTFSAVVGQKHVIQTLKNAIIEDRTSHAYVFSGLRGIGKTSIARILAKAVNCENPIDGEPCNCCASCKAVDEKTTTDIIELDAASNNGVDEIRNILENVNYLPSVLKKRVYIIDEVHMLSTAAFNSLLKTLEEPPAYIMFILATTEPHKIPMTILSRCQRFDFKQLTIEELSTEIKYICEKEDIKIADDALAGIAEAAEGGMRDALSILDQASVYAENEISIDDVNAVTGNISNYKLIELIKAFNNDDATAAISVVNELLNMGKEVSRLTTCVIQFCRDILLYNSVDNVENDKYIYNIEGFKELAEETDNNRLFYYIDVLVDVQNKIRFTNSQKIYLEVGVMKIVNSATDDLELLNRIEALETRLAEEGVPEYSGSGISGNFIQRIDSLESKVKKLQNEGVKVDLSEFKAAFDNKLSVLEENVTRISALPTSLDERVEILEGRISLLEQNEQPAPVDNANQIIAPENTLFSVDYNETESSNNEQIEELSKKLSDYEAKTDALLNCLVEDVEDLKANSDTNTPVENRTSDNEDIIIELMDKVDVLESKLNNTAPAAVDDTRIQKIEAEIQAIKDQLTTTNVVYRQETLQIEQPSTAFDDTLEMKFNELLEEFELIKSEINLLQEQKVEQKVVQPTLFDSESSSIFDEPETQTVETTTPAFDESRLVKIEETIESISQALAANDQKDDKLAQSIQEIKTNYFVLARALENTNTSSQQIQPQVVSTYDETQFKLIEEKVNNLTFEVNDLKSTYLKSSSLEPINEKILEIEAQIAELEASKVTQKVEIKTEEVKPEPVVEKVQEVVEEKPTEVIMTKRRNPYDDKIRELEEKVQEETEEPEVKTVEPIEEKAPEVETKPVEQPQVQVEEVKPAEPVVEEPEEVDISNRIYDVKILENLLHEARNPECKEQKDYILNNWQKISSKVSGGTLGSLARILVSGRMAANGMTHLLIVFQVESLCNNLMEPKNHKDACDILKMTFNRDYDFLALPEKTWNEKRQEYSRQYRERIAKPVLTPFNNPNLHIVVPAKDAGLTERQKNLQKADDFFGD